jgi:hypothetical protein
MRAVRGHVAAGYRAGVGCTILLAATVALGAGCVTSRRARSEPAAGAPPPAKAIKVARELPHAGCRSLGPLRATRAAGEWAAADPKEQDTYGQLTTSTRQLGGDHVLVTAVAKAPGGITVTGAAYDCSDPSARPQVAPARPQAPSGPARAVKIGRAVPHTGCQEIGLIWGTGKGYWPSSEERMQDAYAELMASAQSVGGDFALIDAVAGTDRNLTISGHAYDCSQAPPSAPTVKSTETVEERLGRLEQLKTRGLITPEEYAAKRRAILDEL